jgi:hypothetical protein
MPGVRRLKFVVGNERALVASGELLGFSERSWSKRSGPWCLTNSGNPRRLPGQERPIKLDPLLPLTRIAAGMKTSDNQEGSGLRFGHGPDRVLPGGAQAQLAGIASIAFGGRPGCPKAAR